MGRRLRHHRRCERDHGIVRGTAEYPEPAAGTVASFGDELDGCIYGDIHELFV